MLKNATARPWAGKLVVATGVLLMLATCGGYIHAAELPKPAPPKVGYLAPTAIYTFCAGIDLASTHYALAHGWEEKNPAMQSGRLAKKGAQVVALTLLDHEIAKRSRKTAHVVRGLALAVHVLVAAHNMRAGR